MRTRIAVVLALGASLIALTGCPWNTDKPSFTSADLRSGGFWRWGGLADYASLLGNATDAAEDATPTREVTEPDVYRRVGNMLYILNQYRGLSVVNLDTQQIVSQAPTYGYPRDLYVVGDRAYVLVAQAYDYTQDGDTVSFEVKAKIYVLDISDPASVDILATFDLEGDLVDSRLVGDVLYAVCAEYDWSWYEGGVAVKEQTGDSWVASVNLADPSHIYQADEITFAGTGNVIQATNQAIFVASSPRWWVDDTTITYVDISDPAGDLAVRGNVTIQGYVADRYKMDAWNGVLRVVSSSWANERRVYITTVSLANPDALAVLAAVPLERANGESVFATRFDEDRAYIVTYLVKDPLFVIDLSDPAAPAVIGELEVPGYSTYIEPQGDLLIALGVDDTAGTRVCLSLFDVSEPADPAGKANPTLVDRVYFGEDWSWSSAYSDVKALSVFDDLILVPFSGWSQEMGQYERLQFVSWTTSDLNVRGSVDLEGAAIRSFQYEEAFYGLTAEFLTRIDAADLDNPAITNQLALAENVSDFLELTPQVGVEIVSRYDTGVTTVRTVGLAKGLGETQVTIGEPVASYVRGNTVIIVGTDWSGGTPDRSSYWYGYGSQYYMVATVDCSDPAQPVASTPIKINVEPYNSWYWPLSSYAAVYDKDMAAKADAKSVVTTDGWYPAYRQDSTYLLGDKLVLRCWANDFETVLGTGTPYEGFAVLDLATMEVTSTVGLGYSNVVALNAAAGKLYLSTVDSVDALPVENWSSPQCAYYITEITLGDPQASAGPSVNVPGVFAQYDPDADILTLKDDQWVFWMESRAHLRTVRWDGGDTVSPLDNVTLPEGAAQIMPRGALVYVDIYDNGYSLEALRITDAGVIQTVDTVLVTEDWGSLIDANGTSAYVSIGGGAIARYSFSGVAGTLADLVPVMGTPSKITFGSSAAYAALGYFGVLELPL